MIFKTSMILVLCSTEPQVPELKFENVFPLLCLDLAQGAYEQGSEALLQDFSFSVL